MRDEERFDFSGIPVDTTVYLAYAPLGSLPGVPWVVDAEDACHYTVHCLVDPERVAKIPKKSVRIDK